MEESKLREQIAHNLTYYRKLNGYTQADIAEKINYSDKSVSKWERADGIPDVFVLVQLAELYEISVGELIGQDRPPENIPLTGQAKTRRYIMLLSVGLVWFVATLAFALLQMIYPEHGMWWLAFIYAIPVSFIVSTVLVNVWDYPYRIRLVVSSGIIWGVALALHLTFAMHINIWLIYIISAVFQFVWVYWHKLIMHLLRRK